MRTPLWIINFNKESRIQEFLDRWWKAYGQNSEKAPLTDDLWYYITLADGKSFDDILYDAGHLTLIRDGRDPLIPAFKKKPTPQELNVVFLGDVTDEQLTIPYFHFWAARLRLALLKEETQWTTVTRVHFYGMLWRPNTAAVAPGVSSKTRGFLQELNMFMSQDINHAPFRSVAFVESPDRPEDKSAAFEKMNLAVLHLSAHDYLDDDAHRRFVDLSATGVFYEAAVHTEQGEFLLSNALMDKIVNSKDSEFYNASAAQKFVDGNQDFLDTFACDTLVGELTDECPSPDGKTYAYDLVPRISPWSSKLKKVWTEYYCDFIPNYKKNLVNRVKRNLQTFARDYREKLYINQKDAVTRVAGGLQKQVFRIFVDGSASEYVSLAQAEEILSRYKRKIEDVASGADNEKVTPFATPSELKNAARQAQAENRTPQEAIAVLEDKISHHPVAVFALLVRAIVLGFLLGFLSWTLLPVLTGQTVAMAVTAGLGLFPLCISLLQFRTMRIRIEALKQQYVGIMLLRCEEELRVDILKCLQVTYQELLQYCDWLKTNKLDFLKKHLSVLSPSDFSFVESAVLQPLLKAGNSNTNEENLVLIPPVTLDAIDDIQLSGSFGYEPLLNFDASSPMHQINVEGISYDIKAVVKNNKYLSKLVKQLMETRTKVNRSIERETTFLSRDVQGKTLLLLDVSGSMSGQPLEDLKKAVHSLKESYVVEWIAFDDKIVASSFDNNDIDKLHSGGGTNFIPPLTMAVQKVKEAIYDDIILISDGCPFEDIKDILEVAYELQQPLNTISIGNDGASVMKELSEKTGGVQIVVNEVKEIIHWEGKMQSIVQLGENGEFSFGELIAKCHIPGCARALHIFTSSRILSEAASLPFLIARYPGKGLYEWAHVTQHGASLSQTADVLDEQYLLGLDKEAIENRQFISVVEEKIGNPVRDALEGPLMLATLILTRGVVLRDFLWAGLDENCADLNDREQLKSLLFGNPTICNLYDRPIR
ncbi:MAG: VWA domain-containing protein [Bacteroidaceae bacterium]|nr:VWA domain-containing protein [Bacteroidaceae bacterium]MBO7112065.1 VWA domain-containing protein [Bacteroidaceae bacterium]